MPCWSDVSVSFSRVGNAPLFVFQISNLKYEISNRTIEARWARGETSKLQPRGIIYVSSGLIEHTGVFNFVEPRQLGTIAFVVDAECAFHIKRALIDIS